MALPKGFSSDTSHPNDDDKEGGNWKEVKNKEITILLKQQQLQQLWLWDFYSMKCFELYGFKHWFYIQALGSNNPISSLTHCSGES